MALQREADGLGLWWHPVAALSIIRRAVPFFTLAVLVSFD